jgi:RNA polymerase sigma-70 factor (ECF subfamily)
MTAIARKPTTTDLESEASELSVARGDGQSMSEGVPAGSEAASPHDRERLLGVVREHIDFVWRVLRRHGLSSADADDGVQRVFLVFREKAGGVAPGAEKGFLFRVASFIAREVRRVRPFEEPTDANVTAERSPSDRVEAADFLDKIMRELEDDERAVFLLFEVEGLTMIEIARILDCPQGTVASRLRRARDKVRTAAARLDPTDGGAA